MLSKLAFIAVAAFAAFAAASPVARNQCNTGTQKCCNTVQSASSAAAGSSDLDLINALQSVAANLMVGLGCAPISVIPVGPSSQCAQQPVCCEGNDSTGLISLSCMPITA